MHPAVSAWILSACRFSNSSALRSCCWRTLSWDREPVGIDAPRHILLSGHDVFLSDPKNPKSRIVRLVKYKCQQKSHKTAKQVTNIKQIKSVSSRRSKKCWYYLIPCFHFCSSPYRLSHTAPGRFAWSQMTPAYIISFGHVHSLLKRLVDKPSTVQAQVWHSAVSHARNASDFADPIGAGSPASHAVSGGGKQKTVIILFFFRSGSFLLYPVVAIVSNYRLYYV